MRDSLNHDNAEGGHASDGTATFSAPFRVDFRKVPARRRADAYSHLSREMAQEEGRSPYLTTGSRSRLATALRRLRPSSVTLQAIGAGSWLCSSERNRT